MKLEWWTSRLRGLFGGKRASAKNEKHSLNDSVTYGESVCTMEGSVQKVGAPTSGIPVLARAEGSETDFSRKLAAHLRGGIGPGNDLFVAIPSTSKEVEDGGVKHQQTSSKLSARISGQGNESNLPPPPPPRTSSKIPKVYVRDKSVLAPKTNTHSVECAQIPHEHTHVLKSPQRFAKAEENRVLTKTYVSSSRKANGTAGLPSRSIPRILKSSAQGGEMGHIFCSSPADANTENAGTDFTNGEPAVTSKYSTKDYAVALVPPKDTVKNSGPSLPSRTRTPQHSIPKLTTTLVDEDCAELPKQTTSECACRSQTHSKEDFTTPKQLTADSARRSKRSKKEHAKRLSKRDEEVRRLARNMVGSIESLISNLGGIVSDLHELVHQIDTVTDSIDRTCSHKSVHDSSHPDYSDKLHSVATSASRVTSPRKRQQKQNKEALSRHSCSLMEAHQHQHNEADVFQSQSCSQTSSHKAAADSGDQPLNGNTNLSMSSRRMSYPQFSRASPSIPTRPQAEASDSGRKNQRRPKSSKRARDGAHHTSEHSKVRTEDQDRLYNPCAADKYIISEKSQAGYVSIIIPESYQMHNFYKGANDPEPSETSPKLSSISPIPSGSIHQSDYLPVLASPARESSEHNKMDHAKDPDNFSPLGAYGPGDENVGQESNMDSLSPYDAYRDKNMDQASTADSLSPYGSYDDKNLDLTINVASPSPCSASSDKKVDPSKDLESLPDTGLKNWKAMAERHCGSVESLTPQLDWSYLALTDQLSSAGSGNLVSLDVDHRLHPLTAHHQAPLILSHLQSKMSSSARQINSPSVPQGTDDFAPLLDADFSVPNQTNRPKSTSHIPHPNPQQPKLDPSKLSLPGLSLKHKLRHLSEPQRTRNSGGEGWIKNTGAFPKQQLHSGLRVLPQGRKRSAMLFPAAQLSALGGGDALNWKYSGVFPFVQSRNSGATSSQQNNASCAWRLTQEQVLDGAPIDRSRNHVSGEYEHEKVSGANLETDGDAVFQFVEKANVHGPTLEMNTAGVFYQAEQQYVRIVPADRINAGVASRSASDSVISESRNAAAAAAAAAAAGVFPRVAQSVGGASLGWSTSTKALPDWPSGDLSSIDASDTEVDDLSSPFLPQHFQFPRRSSAVDTSPEKNQKRTETRMSRVASTSSDPFSPSLSQEHFQFSGRSSAGDTSLDENPNQNDTRMCRGLPVSGIVSPEDSPYFLQHFRLLGRHLSKDGEFYFKPFSPAVEETIPGQTLTKNDEAPSTMSFASETMTSGGFEVGNDVEVTPESDVTGLLGGQYECVMETRLEQLSSEAEESDFSDADAYAGSDVLEQSLTSLETSGSAMYDRDVNTWKSYTMTHIDSDDVVSECASDILNENFIETSTTNPGFDDVNLNFDDVNFPSIAY